MIRQFLPLLLLPLLVVFTSQGCALRFQEPARPQPVASNHQAPVQPKHAESVATNDHPSKKKCPDRVDGARVGSLTGTVLGTIVGSAFGMPWLGLVYKFAGSAIGFAAGNACANNGVAEKNGKWAKPADQNSQGNGRHDGMGNEAAEPVAKPPRGISEENI